MEPRGEKEEERERVIQYVERENERARASQTSVSSAL